ncbi:hypothetical protein V1291_004539 [Nitrobacteraceae bacterium AZCC 1564]
MSAKHQKLERPLDRDLDRNPLIGGSKGVTMAQAAPEDLEALEGQNTIEGDVENDTNRFGGINEASRRQASRRGRRKPANAPANTPESALRAGVIQGRKTREQQLRTLNREPDVPDARQVEQEMAGLRENPTTRLPKHREARQSEFPVSRGGLNQESKHNKHNASQKVR